MKRVRGRVTALEKSANVRKRRTRFLVTTILIEELILAFLRVEHGILKEELILIGDSWTRVACETL